jgi:hypothetical protein
LGRYDPVEVNLRDLIPQVLIGISCVACFLLVGSAMWNANIVKLQRQIAEDEPIEFRAMLRPYSIRHGSVKLYEINKDFETYPCSLLPIGGCLRNGLNADGAYEVLLEGKRFPSIKEPNKGGLIVEATMNGTPWVNKEFVLLALEEEHAASQFKARLFLPCAILTVFLIGWYLRNRAALLRKKTVDVSTDK